MHAAVDHVVTLGARFQCDGTAVVLSSEPDSPRAGNDPRNDAGVLGLRFLSQGRLTFDYARGRIWVEWSGSNASR